MARFIPTMRDCGRIRDKADPSRERRELYVGRRAGDSESEIQRARTRVENQRGIQQVRFAEQVALFTTLRNAMNSRNATLNPTSVTNVAPVAAGCSCTRARAITLPPLENRLA